jgi:hypothetical protein
MLAAQIEYPSLELRQRRNKINVAALLDAVLLYVVSVLVLFLE